MRCSTISIAAPLSYYFCAAQYTLCVRIMMPWPMCGKESVAAKPCPGKPLLKIQRPCIKSLADGHLGIVLLRQAAAADLPATHVTKAVGSTSTYIQPMSIELS